MSTTNHRGERGAAAVEMALVLPVLLLVVGGLIDFGRAFYANMVLGNAAREGVRMVALGGYTTAQINQRITDSTPGGLTWSYGAGTPTTCPASPGPTDFATVSLSHTFSYTVLDVVPGILGFTISAPTINATATMRCTG